MLITATAIGNLFYSLDSEFVHVFDMGRMDGGDWTPASRLTYNLRDTISRCTVQVY